MLAMQFLQFCAAFSALDLNSSFIVIIRLSMSVDWGRFREGRIDAHAGDTIFPNPFALVRFSLHALVVLEVRSDTSTTFACLLKKVDVHVGNTVSSNFFTLT